jgi:hypothetical protein
MVIRHILALGAGFLLSSADLQTATPPALSGIWQSESCVTQERAGTRTSSRSTFVFLDDEWALELNQYSDATCTTPALRAFLIGRYRAIRPSTVVQGAYDADFGFTRKRLTLYSEALLAEANRGACGKRTLDTRSRRGRVSNGMLVGRARFSMHPGVRFGESRRRPAASGRAPARRPRSVLH